MHKKTIYNLTAFLLLNAMISYVNAIHIEAPEIKPEANSNISVQIQDIPCFPYTYSQDLLYKKNPIFSVLHPQTHSQNLITLAPSEEPVTIDWGILQNIKFDLKYVPELEISMYTPLFSEEVKALDGKEVIIEGYIIPMYEEGNEVALSANPYASCFFCGQAGPASVMSIFLQKKAGRFKLDDIRKFRGILKLNYDNPDEFYYSLQNATLE